MTCRGRVHALIDCCQVLTLSPSVEAIVLVRKRLEGLVGTPLSPPQLFAVVGMIEVLLAGLRHRVSLPHTGAAFVPDTWKLELSRLDACVSRVRGGTGTPCVRVDWRVRRALRYLDERYADTSISLGALGHQMAVSPSHLARLIRSQGDDSFLGHLHRRRIEAAERLLTTSRLTIKEIAGRVGYRDSAHLCRQFQQRRGISPGRYRQSAGSHSSESASVA